MPILEHDDAIKRYYKLVKEQYPSISFQTFERVCKAPFLFAKRMIREGRFTEVKIKYLGVWRANRYIIESFYAANEAKFKSGARNLEQYNHSKEKYTKLLEDYDRVNGNTN